MDIHYKTNCWDVNWKEVAEILQLAGLSELDPNMQEKVFKNSDVVIFAYHKKKIIGVGRALSDGVCQAAIYNVALRKEYEGKGIGTVLIKKILEPLEGQNIVLYTHPDIIEFYEKLMFRRMKTGMCIYSRDHIEHMEEAGFLLAKGYRYKE